MIFALDFATLGQIAWLIGRATNPKAQVPALAWGSLAAVLAIVGAAVQGGAGPKSERNGGAMCRCRRSRNR